jgi:hypothetical protein
MRRLTFIIVAMAALVLAACGGGTASPPSPGQNETGEPTAESSPELANERRPRRGR